LTFVRLERGDRDVLAKKKPVQRKKYFTVAEANATLPLVRAIVRDISELARDLDERQKRVERCQPGAGGTVTAAHAEEVQKMIAEIERGHEKMGEYVEELTGLGVELKDFQTGLVDFRCRVGNRDVYLCWRLGEPEVRFWHELDAGFAGRQELITLGAPESPMPTPEK
jgi:hypothetical protein